MKIHLPILWLVTVLSFTQALPVLPYYALSGLSLEQREIYEDTYDLVLAQRSNDFNIEKRDISALTFLFTQLNNTATIQLARGALQVELVRQQVISFVEAFIKEKGLTQILKSAGDSGLATDLVMLFVVHFEIYPGLIDIIKAYKTGLLTGVFGINNGSAQSCTSNSGGILGNLFPWFNIGGGCTTNSSGSSGISGSNSGNSSSSSNSGSISGSSSGSGSSQGSGGIIGAIGSILNPFGIFNGGSATSTAASSPGANAATTVSSTNSVSSASSTIAGNGIPFFSNIFPSPTLSVPSYTAPNLFGQATSTSSAVTTPTTTQAVNQAPKSTTLTTTSSNQNGGFSFPTFSIPGFPSNGGGSNTNGGNSGSNSGNSGGLFGNGGLFGGIFKREDLEKNGLILPQLAEREEVTFEELIEAFLEEVSMEKRDNLLDLTMIYQQIIGIIGTNSNIEEIFESLSKSGLAVNVLYNALIDDGFYTFVVELLNDLISKQIITLSILWNALLQSGVVPQVAGVIIGNSAYLRAVFRFIGGILSGAVPVLGLYLAITS